jgi:hypothetical protein
MKFKLSGVLEKLHGDGLLGATFLTHTHSYQAYTDSKTQYTESLREFVHNLA